MMTKVDRQKLPEMVSVERVSPAGVVLETRLVRVIMLYGRGQQFVQTSWTLSGPRECRSYDLQKHGRGTGAHGKAGWRLRPADFGRLQNIRAPRAVL